MGQSHFFWEITSHEIAGLFGKYMLNFIGNCQLEIVFSKVAVPFCSSTRNI